MTVVQSWTSPHSPLSDILVEIIKNNGYQNYQSEFLSHLQQNSTLLLSVSKDRTHTNNAIKTCAELR